MLISMPMLFLNCFIDAVVFADMEVLHGDSDLMELVMSAHAPGTTSRYMAAWRAYSGWCAKASYHPLDQCTLCKYFLFLVSINVKPGNIDNVCAAVSFVCNVYCTKSVVDDPFVALCRRGAVRKLSGRPQKSARALLFVHLDMYAKRLDISRSARN